MTLHLGKQTGSVTNHIYSRAVKGMPEPKIGMGATFLHWTDRSAGTIVRVFSIGNDLAIEVQGDHAKRTDKNGFSEMQTYEYTRNLEAPITTWRFKDNRWQKMIKNPDTGRWNKGDGGLYIGSRDTYWDPCF